MPSFIQSYRQNPGGSITFTDVPVGASTGTSAPIAIPATSDVQYEEFPSSRSVLMTLNNLPVTITLNAGVAGYGSRLLYTMPKSLTQFQVAIVNLTLSTGTVGGLATGASVVGSLGTAVAASTDATLAGAGEATWVASTVCTLTAFAGAFSAISALTALNFIDDRTTARSFYLNFACPAADLTATTTLNCTGTVKIGYNAV